MLVSARFPNRASWLAKMTTRRQGSGRLLAPTLLLAAVGLAFLRGRLSRPARTRTAPGPGQQTAIPQTLPRGKKLVLTDGSFQMVREYQRQGDRVRYYSVERSAWEEIPASLVDWEATQKAEADDAARDKDLSQKIKASELAARTAGIDSDRSLEVRPGVILPDDAGLYVLDGKQVSTLEQDLAVSRVDKARTAERVLTGVPLIPSKHHIELPGKTAKLRIHGSEPEFYFRPVDGRDAPSSFAAARGDRRQAGRRDHEHQHREHFDLQEPRDFSPELGCGERGETLHRGRKARTRRIRNRRKQAGRGSRPLPVGFRRGRESGRHDPEP